MRKSWGIITLSTQLPCPLVCGRDAAGDFHKCEVHLVFGPPPPVFRGGVFWQIWPPPNFLRGWGDGSSAKTLFNRVAHSAGPICMVAWSFGGLVVWPVPSWKGCGRAEDGRRFFTPVALPRRSATALEQLGCQVDWWMDGLSGGPDSCP